MIPTATTCEPATGNVRLAIHLFACHEIIIFSSASDLNQLAIMKFKQRSTM